MKNFDKMTGIQKAVEVKKAMKRADKINMISEGITLAKFKENYIEAFN